MGWVVINKSPHMRVGLRNNGPCTKTRRIEALRHDSKFSLCVEFDEIYNLAFPASPICYQHDPVRMTKTSVTGAINMLGRTKRLHVPILQASTGRFYRDPDVPSQPEHYHGRVNVNGWRQANVAFARAGNALCGAETGATEP